jgi:hypothetical protein
LQRQTSFFSQAQQQPVAVPQEQLAVHQQAVQRKQFPLSLCARWEPSALQRLSQGKSVQQPVQQRVRRERQMPF